jgi:hypothetical protein
MWSSGLGRNKINEIEKNLYLHLIFYYEYFYQGFAIY